MPPKSLSTMAKEMVPMFACGGTQGDINNFLAQGVVGDAKGRPYIKRTCRLYINELVGSKA